MPLDGSSDINGIIAGVVVGIGVIVAVAIAVCFWRKRKEKGKH